MTGKSGNTGRKRRPRGLLSRARSFCRRTDGVAAIEFAIVWPVFILMVFVILEYGLFEFRRASLQYVLFEVARDIQTGEIQNSADPATAFHDAACDYARAFLDCDAITFDARAFANLGDASFADFQFDPDGRPTSGTTEFELGGPEAIMVMQATIPYNFATPMMQQIFQPDGVPAIIVGASMTKNEPFSCQASCS
ncbi:TadE/TadG family type IV pilus assembly protein [Parvularcula oceani]|uniref:TadE/TadG family type IV pilus assembly protein n=1 Tax=Parvularcula oceani TaxID=1247963 RepID=UPI0004E12F68|nr:TadE/TadG family type IV pilus assembly protein [Parvularcula oceani]